MRALLAAAGLLLSAVVMNRQPLAAERLLLVSGSVFEAAPRRPSWPTAPLLSVAAIWWLAFLSVCPVVRAFRFRPWAGRTSAR